MTQIQLFSPISLCPPRFVSESLTISQFSSMHVCPAPCSTSYDTKQGLSRHQRSCQIYNGEDEDAGDDMDERVQRVRAGKRRKLQSSSPGPSTSNLGLSIPDERPPEDEPTLPFDDPPQPSPPAVPSPEPEVTPAGHPIRKKRPTWKLLQLLPEPPAPAPELIVKEPDRDATPPPAPTSFVWESITSAMNSFGLYCEYPCLPTHDPDGTLSLSDISDIPKQPPPSTTHRDSLSSKVPPCLGSPPPNTDNPYYPFPNSTAYGITNWMWSSSLLKSIQEVTKLVEFLKSDAFRKEDLACFNLVTETERLDKLHSSGSDASPAAQDSWSEVSVDIKVPDGQPHSAASPPPLYTVPGLFLRPLSEVIKSAIQDMMSRHFHFTPFKKFHKSHPDAEPSRVYDEIYSSDAMIEAYEKLHTQPGEPGCELERVVLALMWWSDSTHLASFSNASLWPLYLFFGNLSKWVRGKPRSGACHHVAYIPKLLDDFHDFYTCLTGEGPSADVLAHCHRELMHGVWEKILDADFMHAYEHGMVLKCHDGVFHRFYPRLFTYSADYPEKALLAGIRNLGSSPCPRCTIAKDKISGLGTKNDDKNRTKSEREDTSRYCELIETARRRIYELDDAVKSARVERLLSPESLVPTLNTFSQRFSEFGFNFYRMLVPDFLHEFELGVFKSLFSHLIRILISHRESAVHELNACYRMVPPFGRAVICRFDANASAMKKMAARNFEDLLQCAIPVFEGLLPEPYNKTVLSLLFTFAEWHALAKLRMHTSPLVARLSECTTHLGRQLRHFVAHTCSQFDTRELPKEEAARGRRKARKSKSKATPTPSRQHATAAAKKKSMNLNTYKLHSLGDYVQFIPWFGTSDSYSTQTGELEHCRVKRYYARTNKNAAVGQMTTLERREQSLRCIAAKLAKILPAQSTPTQVHPGKGRGKAKKQKLSVDFVEEESLPYTVPNQHHHISTFRNLYINIPQFLHDNEGDPAVHNFLSKLKDHLVGRLAHPEWSSEGEEFTPEQHRSLLIANDRLYRHRVLQVNYTTYDVRQGQDSMNPRMRADIMTLTPEDNTSHPFSYAHIIGIFHVDVIHNVPGASTIPTSVEVLWVRHFHHDTSFWAGFKAKRLHRLEFIQGDDPRAFGFMNPDEVIRGSHLIPAFHYGRTHDLLGASLIRHEDDIFDGEWRYHYVNFFVDRDMYLRYAGSGIGHFQVTIEAEAEEPEDLRDIGLDEDEDEPPGEPVAAASTTIVARGPKDSETQAGRQRRRRADDQSESDDTDGDRDSTVESSEDEDEERDEASGRQRQDSDEEVDLGPEDGLDHMEDEEVEGYAPL